MWTCSWKDGKLPLVTFYVSCICDIAMDKTDVFFPIQLPEFFNCFLSTFLQNVQNTDLEKRAFHYYNLNMLAMASQITSLTIVYSTVYSGADQRKHQSSASLAFVWGIHRRPVNSPHKGPAVTRKMFPFDDVIMIQTFTNMQSPKIVSLSMLLECIVWDPNHDDVIKWKHFPRYWPFVRRIHRSPVNSPHKSQWRGTLMFSLICVWIND